MTAYPDVYIVGAARTPIGKFLGALSTLKASDLGAVAIRAAMERAGIGGRDVDEVLMGHVVQGEIKPCRRTADEQRDNSDQREGDPSVLRHCGRHAERACYVVGTLRVP